MSVFNQERARTYDAGARTSMAGYEALHDMARDGLAGYLDPHKPARVLLLGVGTGYEAEQLQQRFPTWQLIGVDPSEPMLNLARQRLTGVDLRLGVLDDFADLVELDGVLSVGVLHHLPTREEQPEWVRSIGQRLRPGGVALVGCQVGPYQDDSPQLRALQARWRHLGGLTSKDLEERVRLFLTHTLPPTRRQLDEWYRKAGLSKPETLFSTAYFQLLAALKN
ncbi:MAG: class I SAM-dependent methyltransferase [Candidatus Eremiobacteraeota bacterium]|nr:class I SAM-dependent methyltransferase [Candidatus Eremiobacteraeota bacterium]MCW5870106.1 class I SAM-dependent methyltransferase [Candidatus Eremiobacteraeota bacterium]